MPKPNWETVVTSAVVYVVLTAAASKFGFITPGPKMPSFFIK